MTRNLEDKVVLVNTHSVLSCFCMRYETILEDIVTYL